jgi:ATP-binding cassette, subfamily B, bacterial
MTMYLLLFRQGQSAVSASLSAISGMYEDNLYLSTLYEYLETPVPRSRARDARAGPGATACASRAWASRYPGADEPALEDVTLHLKPGTSLALVGENGSGKTTLIKLLTRLYEPTAGGSCSTASTCASGTRRLRARVGVIFQDFARYQMLVGENVGAGDEPHFEDEARWREAAEKGQAAPFIERLPAGYRTQLGKWFKDGRELSAASGRRSRCRAPSCAAGRHPGARRADGGDGRAAPRPRSSSTSASSPRDRITILISHRFSTVRMADQIAVLDRGRIVELGSHDELIAANGTYAALFTLQAKGYR